MRLIGAAFTAVVLAGCSGTSVAIPPQNILAAPGGLTAPPKCKAQKQTKYYATVAKQSIKETAGASVCVPAFGGWGGGLQFRGTYNAAYTVALTSSTKTYKGGLFPPAGSKKPIF